MANEQSPTDSVHSNASVCKHQQHDKNEREQEVNVEDCRSIEDSKDGMAAEVIRNVSNAEKGGVCTATLLQTLGSDRSHVARTDHSIKSDSSEQGQSHNKQDDDNGEVRIDGAQNDLTSAGQLEHQSNSETFGSMVSNPSCVHCSVSVAAKATTAVAATQSVTMAESVITKASAAASQYQRSKQQEKDIVDSRGHMLSKAAGTPKVALAATSVMTSALTGISHALPPPFQASSLHKQQPQQKPTGSNTRNDRKRKLACQNRAADNGISGADSKIENASSATISTTARTSPSTADTAASKRRRVVDTLQDDASLADFVKPLPLVSATAATGAKTLMPILDAVENNVTNTTTVHGDDTAIGKSLDDDDCILLQDGIEKIVNDVQVMLQIYGPLTSAQLYHNLPTANTLNSENSLYHVLDALTALGVIHIVDEERTRAKRDGTDEKMYQRRQDQKQREQCTGKQERAVGERAAEKSADKAANTNDFDTAQSNPSSSQHQEQLLQQQEEQQRSQQRYVFLGGQARIDRLTIPQLLPSLQKAQQDIDDSVRRIRLLREELMKRVPPPRLVTPQQNKDKTLSKNVVEDEVIDGNEHCEESDEISMTAAAASSDDIALNLNKKKHQDGKCEKEEHSKRRSMREVMTCLLSISPSLARDPFYSAALENVGLTGGNSSKTHGR